MMEKDLDASTDFAVLTEQDWEGQKDYADAVRIQVRFKSWPGADDDNEVWILHTGEAGWSNDWLSLQLVKLAIGKDAWWWGWFVPP